MLNIRPLHRPLRVVQYYCREEEGRHAGIWLGRGCRLVGVRQGTVVERAALGLVLDGYSVSGRSLVPVVSRRRRCAHDMVFSVTKPVSIAGVCGEEALCRRIYRAIHKVIRAAVRWIEELVKCRGRTRRGAALCVSAFVHEFSRMGDPHLHVHLLVMNFTAGGNGEVRAIETRPVFNHHLAVERRFQQELKRELRKRGIAARLDVAGRATLEVDPVLCREVSGMRVRIEQVSEKFRVEGKGLYRLREIVGDRLAKRSRPGRGRLVKKVRCVDVGIRPKWRRVGVRPSKAIGLEVVGDRWRAAMEVLRRGPRRSLDEIWDPKRSEDERRRIYGMLHWRRRVVKCEGTVREREGRSRRIRALIKLQLKMRLKLQNSKKRTPRKTI